jgi:hypothetical protein
MPTSAAGVFAVIAAPLDETDPVAEEKTFQGVGDPPPADAPLDERMPAATRVLEPAGSNRDDMHAMTEQAAEISNPFVEPSLRRIRIVAVLEQQRVTTSQARIFRMSVAMAGAGVRVMLEEARQGVPDSHRPAIVAKESAAAPLAAAGAGSECLVVHDVAPERTSELRGDRGLRVGDLHRRGFQNVHARFSLASRL